MKHFQFFFLFVCLFWATSAFAVEYEYIWEPTPNPTCNESSGGIRQSAGTMDVLHTTFDTETNELVWETQFVPCDGQSPNGYWLAMSAGPNPKNHPGELVMFYFDATEMANPILTAYGYNGQNGSNSYRDGDGATGGNQEPDRILSSLVSTDWIHELSAVQVGDVRTFRFRIDATAIKNHIPLYPDPDTDWYGCGFGDAVSGCGQGHLGFWFHPIQIIEPAPLGIYCAPGDDTYPCHAGTSEDDGFLKSLTFGNHGRYDKSCRDVNARPVCELTGPSQTVECEGDVTTVSFDGSESFDPDGDDLETYFTTDCENAELLKINEFVVEILLTDPGLGQAVECTVTLHLSDGYDGEESCEAPVSVDPCDPDCPSGNYDECGVCDGPGATGCDEQCGSNKEFDQCAVCGGTDECLDCFDVPFGTAVEDRCAVCDGNGQSCLDCSDVDISAIQFSIDNGAGLMKRIVKRSTRLYKLANGGQEASKKVKNNVKAFRAEADALFEQAWVVSWSIPSVQTSCVNTFCVEISNVGTIEEYLALSAALESLNADVVKKGKRSLRGSNPARHGISDQQASRMKKKLNRQLARANEQNAENEALALQIPATASACD